MDPSRTLIAFALITAVAISAAGCGDRFTPDDPPALPPATGTPGGGEGGVGAISTVPIEHPLFRGASSLVAGDGLLRVEWQAATDDEDESAEIFYRGYVAAGPGDQDYTEPSFETAAAATAHELSALTNGVTQFVVVRAVDLDGNEDPNLVEWAATPNPVRYVDRASVAAAPDGKTPATAYRVVGQAIGTSIALGGVNIWVAEGLYSENAFLFPGMCLYGGFTSGFSLAERDSEAHLTELRVPVTPFSVDVVTILESTRLSGVDGFQLDGNAFAGNGVKIDDAFFRVTNCGIRNSVAHGMELRSKVLDGLQVEGAIRRCAIVANQSEGISISALADIVIDDNVIRDNANEGIEAQYVYGAAGIDTRIEITRNRIEGNGEEGIDLDFAEASETDPTQSQGARVRAVVRNNEIAGNGMAGVLIDIDYEASDGIDFRARVEDNHVRANRGPGVQIDGDARGSIRLARNAIAANAGWGVDASGTVDGPVLGILHCRILGNAEGGVRLGGRALASIHHSAILSNAGAAVSGPHAYIDISGCALRGNAGTSHADHARWSFALGEVESGALGAGVVSGDPGFELEPRRVRRALAGSQSGQIVVSDIGAWQVGDVAELRDDGVAREVIAVLADRIVVEPAPDPAAAAGDAVFAFFPDNIVTESEFLPEEAAGLEAGDPLERDRDTTRADVGPRAGDTPGNVGIETGIAEERTPIELIALEPQAGTLQAGEIWRLIFNRAPPAELSGEIVLLRGGTEELRTTQSWSGNVLELGTAAELDIGERVVIELRPFANDDQELRQPRRQVLEWTIAQAFVDADSAGVDANGTVADAQTLYGQAAVVEGTIDAPIAGDPDVDYFEVRMAAGTTLSVDIAAQQLASALLPRVSIFSADGGELLAQGEATPPALEDPHVEFTAATDGSVLVRVQSTDATGSALHTYRLELRLR